MEGIKILIEFIINTIGIVALVMIIIFILEAMIYMPYKIIKDLIKNDRENNNLPNYEKMINILNLKIDNLQKTINEMKKED